MVSRTRRSSSTISTRPRVVGMRVDWLTASVVSRHDRARPGRWVHVVLPLDRQADGDPRAPVHLAFHLDLATECKGQPLRHRQEKARAGEFPSAYRHHRAERPEDARLLLGSEADAVVGHGDDDLAVALVAGHADLSDLGVLDR